MTNTILNDNAIIPFAQAKISGAILSFSTYFTSHIFLPLKYIQNLTITANILTI